MTVSEKMKEVFGIGFTSDSGYHSGMITCAGVLCGDCPLKTCGCDGINEWLESEYHEKGEKKIAEEKIKTEEYQKGFEDGKAQVMNDLSKIFLRR